MDGISGICTDIEMVVRIACCELRYCRGRESMRSEREQLTIDNRINTERLYTVHTKPINNDRALVIR